MLDGVSVSGVSGVSGVSVSRVSKVNVVNSVSGVSGVSVNRVRKVNAVNSVNRVSNGVNSQDQSCRRRTRLKMSLTWIIQLGLRSHELYVGVKLMITQFKAVRSQFSDIFAEMDFVAPPEQQNGTNVTDTNTTQWDPDPYDFNIPTTTVKFTIPAIPTPLSPTITVTVPK